MREEQGCNRAGREGCERRTAKGSEGRWREKKDGKVPSTAQACGLRVSPTSEGHKKKQGEWAGACGVEEGAPEGRDTVAWLRRTGREHVREAAGPAVPRGRPGCVCMYVHMCIGLRCLLLVRSVGKGPMPHKEQDDSL